MKMQLTILFTTIGMICAGCTPVTVTTTISPAPIITKTVEPSVTNTLESFLPSPSPTLTPPSIPTLAMENAYLRLVELLQNNADCFFPCLWGISPGISTNSDVQNVILPLTGIAEYSRLPSSIFGGMIFNIPAKDDTRVTIFLSYFPSSDSQSINAIYLEAQAFHIGGDPARDQSFYGSDHYMEILDKYTLHRILSNYGIPSEVLVFVEPSNPKYFNLRILYIEKGIYLSYGAFVEEHGANYYGCPSKMFVSLYLLSTESNKAYQEVLPTIGPDWDNVFPRSEGDFKSLEEATHMSLDEFYQTFKNPSDRCLETPKSIWLP